MLFVVDNEVGKMTSESGIGEASWPDHPGEKPAKVDLKRWIDKWDSNLDSSGYAAPLRGQEPFDWKRLKERKPLPVPRGADAARTASIEAKNDDIRHDNTWKREEKHARALELKNRLSGKLTKAMRRAHRGPYPLG